MIASVGIIANPASGKDIRRLVAHGSVFDNEEKVNIVRRVLYGLAAVGVAQVLLMPESYGIGQRAAHGLPDLPDVAVLPMRPLFSQKDSQRAAEMLVAAGVGCIVTLGGDGTNRMVARGCGELPLMPISTGTNNVFPMMIEGTIAGLAAGLVARGAAPDAVPQVSRIEVFLDREPDTRPPDDIALIDAAIYAQRFIASRAVWETEHIRELLLTRAEPGNIGLSSIGGHLLGGTMPPGKGLFVRAGHGDRRVLAPIAPGLVQTVGVVDSRLLNPGDALRVAHDEPCVLALDGEREHELPAGRRCYLRLSSSGPRVVDPRAAIAAGVVGGYFCT